MSITGSDNSKDLINGNNNYNNDSYHNNYQNNGTQFTTDTNMFPHLLANPDKLIPENDRWEFKKEERSDNHLNNHLNNYHNQNDNYVHGNYDNDLDDNIGNYMNKKDNYDNYENEQPKLVNGNNDNVFQKKSRDDSYHVEENDRGKGMNGVSNDNYDKPLSNEELMLEKLNTLRRLAELTSAGVKLSQLYNMNSDLNMMKYEYELHKNVRAKQNGINWMSSMTLNMIYGIEMLNDKYDPFSLKLSGWSEQMNADANSYYDVFGELYEKYNQPGKNMAPELKLLLMISGSALKFHLSSTIMNKTSTLNEHIMMNPNLAEEYRQRAIADKIRDQTIKNNNVLNNMMGKEHAVVAQKTSDLQLIKEKEMEYLNMQRKEVELEELRKKLSMQNNNLNINNNDTKANMNLSPAVQKMMTKMNENNGNNNNINNNINNNVNNNDNLQKSTVDPQIIKQQMEHQRRINEKQLQMLELQQKALKQKIDMDAIQQLQKLQYLKSEEEKLINTEKILSAQMNTKDQKRKEKQNPNSDRSKYEMTSYSSLNSEVTLHDLDDVFSKSGNNIESSEHQKITQIDTVDEDDISNRISLGGRSKKSKGSMSKTSSRIERKKKNGISLDF